MRIQKEAADWLPRVVAVPRVQPAELAAVVTAPARTSVVAARLDVAASPIEDAVAPLRIDAPFLPVDVAAPVSVAAKQLVAAVALPISVVASPTSEHVAVVPSVLVTVVLPAAEPISAAVAAAPIERRASAHATVPVLSAWLLVTRPVASSPLVELAASVRAARSPAVAFPAVPATAPAVLVDP